MILALFSDLSSSCWKLKFPAKTAGDPPVSYARRQIAVMADALAQKALQGTECTRLLLTALFNGLMRPIGSESPKDIIELVNKFDWPKILQDKDVNAIQDKATKIYYDYSNFILLHAWACRLLAKDVENEMAKTFIREHLGSCTKLLQTCLRRIIHEGVQMGREIENLAIVVIEFMICLVPVPIDRETIALVRRAKSALEQALLRNKTSDDPFLMENIALGTYNFKVQRIKTLIYNMSVWQQAHYLSDEKRWYYFHDFFLSGGNTLAADRRLVKDARKSCKKKVKLVAGLQGGEMCANCFVLEKTLLEEQEEYDEGGGNNSNSNDGGLMKCSRCLQIKYCSRECQGEHWKKAHKLHCKSIKTAKLPSSSLSKKS
jgi:MYND finger